jgi:hypothetical protein
VTVILYAQLADEQVIRALQKRIVAAVVTGRQVNADSSQFEIIMAKAKTHQA